ncbi:hypothetical protein GcM3_076026 [Golovinomyces cichoracearum]|uniref:Secreted effector protein n=1 Tax=Golovinomyces cichoracearum TaxID=62708 RepID=A0A420IQM7_9PEZI|nr:hypothetical protein GcM3_076026 [Golovinomyces cichoracearum]
MKITYHATIFSILCALVCGTPMNGTPASQNGNFEFRGLQKNVKCSNRYVYSKDELNEKGRYACETRMKLESNGRLRQMLAFINPLGEVKLYRGGAFKPDSEDAVLYRLSLNRFKGYNPLRDMSSCHGPGIPKDVQF